MVKENGKTLFVIVVLFTLYRAWVLHHAHIDLYVDEAYYWGWSKNLSFGYYSKPPMIAWTIALFTSLCGDSLFCIKLPALLLYPLSTLFIYLSAKELFGQKTAFWSGLIFFTLPSVSMSSLIISTDVLLLLFWSISLYFFIKAINSDRVLFWLGAGVSAGFGLLSKYTMIIFLLSVFVYLAIDPRYRRHLVNPRLYLAAFIAALIYMPNLVWNAQHHFITFLHTKQISGIEGKLFHPDKMLSFLAAQFLVFGPLFFGVLLYLFVKPIKRGSYLLLYSFTVPFLAIITLQSFLSKALANWAAPTYVAASILVAAWLVERGKKTLLLFGIALNILLALLFYHYHTIMKVAGVELTSKNDPYKRVLGFHQLARKLAPIVRSYPDAKLLFDSRETMAQMIYYLHPHPFDAVMFNPKHEMKSQYHLFTDMNRYKGKNFLYITAKKSIEDMRPYFKEIRRVAKIEIPLYKNYARIYYVYYLQGFKGY